MKTFTVLKKAGRNVFTQRSLLSIAAAFGIVHSAIAAEIQTVRVDQNEAIISIVGQLEVGDGGKFTAATAGIQNALILFKSPGGDLGSGINIGEEIRRKHYSTGVPFDDICASACAIAWVGGTNRFLSPHARVGFHSASTVLNGNSSEAGVGDALMGAYFSKLGLSYEGIYSLTSSSPDEMKWITAESAQNLKITVKSEDIGEVLMQKKSSAVGLTLMLSALAAPSAYSAEPLSRATAQGYDNGFHDCARALDKIVKFIHENDAGYANFGQWATSDTNNKVFSTTTVQPYESGNSVTHFTAEKNRAGMCDITFTQILYVKESCLQTREETFKTWKYYGEAAGSIIIEDPSSPNLSVVLTNQPNNTCLLVKTFVSFDVAP